jgi:hypothetical protein
VRLHAESQRIHLDELGERFTSKDETILVCWLAQQASGNIVEIGCNRGLTTRALALSNPNKLVFAVDYLVPAEDSHWQDSERPSVGDFCAHARQLPNVVVVHEDSAHLRYDALADVGFVFIDGDHTYDAVRVDSEHAIRHIKQRGAGTIVWHDYKSEPGWCGVKPFLDELEMPVFHIAGTWLAFILIGSDPTQLVSARDSSGRL